MLSVAKQPHAINHPDAVIKRAKWKSEDVFNTPPAFRGNHCLHGSSQYPTIIKEKMTEGQTLNKTKDCYYCSNDYLLLLLMLVDGG